MNKLVSITLLCLTFNLVACVHNKDEPTDLADSIHLRPIPNTAQKLKDECILLKGEIQRLNQFSEKMNHSRFAMHYQVLNSEKISAIRKHTKKIGCT